MAPLSAVKETGADASVIYVPAPFVLDSIVEAVDSGVELIVVITEGGTDCDKVWLAICQARTPRVVRDGCSIPTVTTKLEKT